jgi:hypothetical protein
VDRRLSRQQRRSGRGGREKCSPHVDNNSYNLVMKTRETVYDKYQFSTVMGSLAGRESDPITPPLTYLIMRVPRNKHNTQFSNIQNISHTIKHHRIARSLTGSK